TALARELPIRYEVEAVGDRYVVVAYGDRPSGSKPMAHYYAVRPGLLDAVRELTRRLHEARTDALIAQVDRYDRIGPQTLTPQILRWAVAQAITSGGDPVDLINRYRAELGGWLDEVERARQTRLARAVVERVLPLLTESDRAALTIARRPATAPITDTVGLARGGYAAAIGSPNAGLSRVMDRLVSPLNRYRRRAALALTDRFPRLKQWLAGRDERGYLDPVLRWLADTTVTGATGWREALRIMKPDWVAAFENAWYTIESGWRQMMASHSVRLALRAVAQDATIEELVQVIDQLDRVPEPVRAAWRDRVAPTLTTPDEQMGFLMAMLGLWTTLERARQHYGLDENVQTILFNSGVDSMLRAYENRSDDGFAMRHLAERISGLTGPALLSHGQPAGDDAPPTPAHTILTALMTPATRRVGFRFRKFDTDSPYMKPPSRSIVEWFDQL
ncbi:MAG: hypothetical protein NZ518_09945, partial [Dehalococcoidia bacterium]|nr:hypothetical protein [Dehalococcoidia bacterium]